MEASSVLEGESRTPACLSKLPPSLLFSDHSEIHSFAPQYTPHCDILPHYSLESKNTTSHRLKP